MQRGLEVTGDQAQPVDVAGALEPVRARSWSVVALLLVVRAVRYLFPRQLLHDSADATRALAYHMANVRAATAAAAAAREAYESAASRRYRAAVRDRILTGYGRHKGRLLRPDELRPAKRKAAAA